MLSRSIVGPIACTRRLSCCHWFEPSPLLNNGEGMESIWQVDTSSVKFGPGVLGEIGADVATRKLKRVAVFTDPSIATSTPHLNTVLESLHYSDIDAVVYTDVSVEPTDMSFKAAAAFAMDKSVDGFVSVGGGSVIDTCKAANLYSSFPAEFLDYVNPPIGRGILPPGSLKPHIACPTTAGTGSENTGIAVFDFVDKQVKTGIACRAIRPDAALIDPLTTLTLPKRIVAASGFDVLSHAFESFTAKPFTQRKAPTHPSLRPASQGSNPYSDVGCREALSLCGQYLVQACDEDVENPQVKYARSQMMFAATLAGIAFGNCGCHIPHAMSYGVKGVQHGLAVICNAPGVFKFTFDACPSRHLEAGQLLGMQDVSAASIEVQRDALEAHLVQLMQATAIPIDLNALGYTSDCIPELVSKTLPQKRLLDNSPKTVTASDLSSIFEANMNRSSPN